MTGDVELVTKSNVIGADGEPVTFHGVRFWLKGTDDLHRTEHDDDRPAITFWVGDIADATRLACALDDAAGLPLIPYTETEWADD